MKTKRSQTSRVPCRSGPRTCSLLLFLCVAINGVSLAGSLDLGSKVFVNGTLDVATAFGNEGVPQFHEFIRGDSPFDPVRLRLFGDVAFSRRLTLFNQFLIDPDIRFGPKSFIRSYLRLNVFETQGADLSIQAGKLPTVFGNLGNRAYSSENPLISTPLVYHYFSSLRGNQLPANNRDLLQERGNGLSREFGGFAGGGARRGFNGLPIIYDTCWDVGVQVIGSVSRLEYSVAVTQGTLSDPRTQAVDNNGGKQLALRLKHVFSAELSIGGSFARGPYLSSLVQPALGAGRQVEDFNQRVYGIDVEYVVGHLSVVAEVVSNLWQTPNIKDLHGNRSDLTNWSGYVEGKYGLRPGLFAAFRYDTLGFGKIDDGLGAGVRVPWDYGVRSWEMGLGYYLTDQVIAKIVQQVHKIHEPGGSWEPFWAVQLSTSF